jgi:hypothetical protein
LLFVIEHTLNWIIFVTTYDLRFLYTIFFPNFWQEWSTCVWWLKISLINLILLLFLSIFECAFLWSLTLLNKYVNLYSTNETWAMHKQRLHEDWDILKDWMNKKPNMIKKLNESLTIFFNYYTCMKLNRIKLFKRMHMQNKPKTKSWHQ